MAETHIQLCFATLFLFGTSNNLMTLKLVNILYAILPNLNLCYDHRTCKHQDIRSLVVFPQQVDFAIAVNAKRESCIPTRPAAVCYLL